ncbi:hypothetical protein GQX73_g5965 [Xylaria multiplex]|uniref:Uncharacterized protein n=1 Tax=Xylaria multiplex TaxID=323545 RepID=A0A7C8ITE1_9PEZI|nr:hypothetical protein GQX73_g5965 [Xylaria multiplex]
MPASNGQQSFIETTGIGVSSPHYDMQPVDGGEHWNGDGYDQRNFQQTYGQDLSTVRLTSAQQIGDGDSTDLEDEIPLKDSTEVPPLPQRRKMIQSSSAGPAIGQFLVFQFPALAFTTTLLILYLRYVSWSPTADQLGVLLVVAKIHETLIIASLFNIVIYHIRRGLLGHRGIPYGFLTAPFQLTSPFYLFTSEFWSCLHSANMHTALLALLVIVSFILAALAGASSGIIIIPKLGWRAVPRTMEDRWKSSGRSIPGLAGYAISPSTSIFPSNIDLSIVPEICMNASSGTSKSSRCPYYGLTDSSAVLYTNFGDIGNWPDTVNLTISNTDLRTMSYFSDFLYGQLIAVTTPLRVVESILFSGSIEWNWRGDPVQIATDLRDANGDVMTVKQPRVITQCSDTAYGVQGNDTDTPYYNFRMLRFFYPQFNFTVPKAIFQDALDSKTHLGFIDMNEYLPDAVNTSVAFWTRDTLYKEHLSICLVDARWLGTDAWILPFSVGSKIQHSLTINTNRTTTYGNVSSTGDDLIHIDPAWGNLLNQPLHSNAPVPVAPNATSVFSLLTQYLNSDTSYGYGTRYNHLAAGLTIVLTEALATVPSSQAWRVEWHSEGPWKPDPNYNQDKQAPFAQIQDLGDYALLKAGIYENVYSYSFGEITTILSWVVLFSHYLLVLVHLIILYLHGGRTSKRWGRLGEVMCLALNSRPTDLLTNTSAGVRGSKIWGFNATVREVGAEGRVELVLRDGKAPGTLYDHGIIQPDRKYG